MGHDIAKLVNIATDLMQHRWPEALGGFAGGSIFRGQGKPHSDIDLVILLPQQDKPRKYWLRHQDVPFDVFCHDEHTLRHYALQDRQDRRHGLLAIMADGVILPEPKPVFVKWQRYARNVLQKGFLPLAQDERLARRYFLMDCLDDYADATDPAERYTIATRLHTLLLETICLLGDGQLGNGKWLGRLAQKADAPLTHAVNAALAADLANPADFGLLEIGEALLACLGGRLKEEACMEGRAENRKEKLRLFLP